MQNKLNTPFFSFETTLKCNLKCTMCSNPSESENNPLSKEEIANIITEAMQFTDRIVFSGGEPLLEDDLPYYFSLIPENKHITVLTNGTLFNNANFLQVVNRISELRVSIDDNLETEKSLYRLGSNPKRILNDLIKVRSLNEDMIIVITSILNDSFSNNLIEFFQYFENAESQVDIIRFIPQVYYKGRTPENLKNSLYKSPEFETITNSVAKLVKYYIDNQLHKQIDLDIQHLFSSQIFEPTFEIQPFSLTERCCDYQNGLFINNNGDLILCPSSYDVLANYRNYKSIEKLLSFRFSDDFVKKHTTAKILISEKKACVNCRYYKLCGGGCPANSLGLTSNILNPDPIKCSYSILWEKHILPFYPSNIQSTFNSVLNSKGTVPKYFKDIYEILDSNNN